MTAHEIITSNDYIDLIVENSDEVTEFLNEGNNTYSFHSVDIGEYRILHIHNNALPYFWQRLRDRIKYDFPLPFGFLDEIGLFQSGIDFIQTQPYLQLRGTGVAIAIIDSGIDYTHPAFLHADNTTRILRIWDQTIDGTPPEGFYFGHEYTAEDINRALQSEDPYSVVDHRDTEGHGTAMAGIASGYDLSKGFIGAAPEAELIIVKVKPAKQNFKEHWMILKENLTIFASTDIILGSQYVIGVASRLNKPVVANSSFGTSQGPHDNTGISGSSLEDIGRRRGVALIGAVGNEGIARSHTNGTLPEIGEQQEIELKVGNNELGFCLEIWVTAPDIMSVLVKSPMGETVEMLPRRFNSTETTNLMFEKSVITIEYRLSHYLNGNQVIRIKFKYPTPGIWTLTLRSHIYLFGRYQARLPLKGWIESDTVFLSPTPEYTVTTPGAFTSIITVGAYNHRDGSLFVDSSRGPSYIGDVRPDLVAPGVNLEAPMPNKEYTILSGTSVSSALVAGCAALLLEWGVIRGNDPAMNTYKIRNYLIGGAKRENDMSYPNNIWGFGKLDLYGAFEIMRL